MKKIRYSHCDPMTRPITNDILLNINIYKQTLIAMEPQKKKLKQQKSKCVLYTDQEIEAKQQAGRNINTTKTEEWADRAFKRFLSECGELNLDYWYYQEPELDNFLSKFWFGARKDPDSDYESDTEDPERHKLMYTANTMKSFRYNLNRILKNKGHEYDIMNTHSLSFKKFQQAFMDSQKELKALGKGEIKSAPEITEEGQSCLLYLLMNDTPIRNQIVPCQLHPQLKK